MAGTKRLGIGSCPDPGGWGLGPSMSGPKGVGNGAVFGPKGSEFGSYSVRIQGVWILLCSDLRKLGIWSCLDPKGLDPCPNLSDLGQDA